MLQVYNYMLESYPIKREVMYPVHKRSELKKVYNNIVSLSKKSPLYKVNLTKENQEYTIGIKETALLLKSRLEEMSEAEKSGFQSKSAIVSDGEVVSAKLIGEETEGLPEEMIFRVDNLASVQINLGKDLYDDSRGLPPGAYHFYARTPSGSYKLTFVQEERDENRNVMRNLVNYINHDLPGVNASIEKGASSNYSRVVLISEQAGKNGEPAMSFSDENYDGIVEYFGLDRVEKQSQSAVFSINDTEHTTSTNTFHLENCLQITLNSKSERPVTVKIGPDSKKILSAVETVLDTFNGLVRIAQNRTADTREHYRASKLIGEMKNLEQLYTEELTACGIKADEKGFLSIEASLAVQAAEDGGMESLFMRENGFITRLIEKTESIAINPMEYLDKTVVTYPNNENKTFRNPYVTSMYSGLFFSSYC